VLAVAALLKVTCPGPAILLQDTVEMATPFSVAVPFNEALAGKVIVCEGPALTTGDVVFDWARLIEAEALTGP
jgi:hypothetical protein